MKRIGVALLLAALLSVAAGVDGAKAQAKPRDMIHAYRVYKLTEVLELSDEEMPLFFSRLKELDEKEAELVREEQKGIGRIAELLQREDVSDEELERALESHRRSRAQLLDEIGNLKEKTMSMLNIEQQAKYLVFEHRFRAELRDMIERAREMGRGRSEETDRTGVGEEFGRPDPGGRGVGGGMPGGSGRGRR